MNRTLEKLVALVLIILLLPVLVLLSLLITACDGWPFWYMQNRVGYKGKIFGMWKFRTMVMDAESQKSKIKSQNEVDGPVFKIRNDPRFTRWGKFLSHIGVDEMPQLINILVGEMSFIGPRPLPMEEAEKIPDKYKKRLSVMPGIISPWIFDGYHNLSFEKWMQSDMDYIRDKNWRYDIRLCLKGIETLVKMVWKETIDILTRHLNSG